MNDRLLSLDFFRGFTMFLLIAEGTHFFSVMTDPTFDNTLIGAIGTQFHHHPWNGLRFWDLIQPFFMFIVGVSMPMSLGKRTENGATPNQNLAHVLKRSGLLLLLGWMLECIGRGSLTLQFQNVLAQLSVTYLIAYLLIKRKWGTQLAISLLLLLLTDLAYRFFWVDGYNQPFTPDKNLGAYVDMVISGHLSGGHWVSLNAIPTAAHTIWGVLAGQLLMSKHANAKKLKYMIIAGAIGLIAGYALDPLTPIVKRIATSSFVIVTGGWCVLAIALSYYVIDMLKFQRGVTFFVIVGMNPLFIYLFANTGGARYIYRLVKPFTMGAFSWTEELYAQWITSAVAWALLWYMCYWLYKKKIFIRI